jgi:hypothetical protein
MKESNSILIDWFAIILNVVPIFKWKKPSDHSTEKWR